jgi:glycosyltransferase involved in cell wall biosynthesis
MNILYIADSSSWHNVKWTEYFAERHHVYLFSDFKEDYKPVFFDDKVTLIQMPPPFKTKNRHLNKIMSIYHYVKCIRKIITDYDIDIIHCVAIYYAFLGSLLRVDIPLIYTQQGSELLVRAQKSFLYRYMAKRIFEKVDIVTGDSKVIQAAGIKYGALHKNNYIIQNGVDLRLFKSESKILNCCLQLYSPRAITPLYNIDVIIKALHLLKSKHHISFKCKFTFGFGEEYLANYKGLVEHYGLNDYVEWIGYVDHSEMPHHYASSDITISVPSSDSSPKSVYESMACGVPVIVSDLPWVNESLIHNVNVIVCKKEDSENLANSILKLTTNIKLYSSVRSSALELVKDHFSYSKEMRKMEIIMLDAISSREY